MSSSGCSALSVLNTLALALPRMLVAVVTGSGRSTGPLGCFLVPSLFQSGFESETAKNRDLEQGPHPPPPPPHTPNGTEAVSLVWQQDPTAASQAWILWEFEQMVIRPECCSWGHTGQARCAHLQGAHCRVTWDRPGVLTSRVPTAGSHGTGPVCSPLGCTPRGHTGQACHVHPWITLSRVTWDSPLCSPQRVCLDLVRRNAPHRQQRG